MQLGIIYGWKLDFIDICYDLHTWPWILVSGNCTPFIQKLCSHEEWIKRAKARVHVYVLWTKLFVWSDMTLKLNSRLMHTSLN